MKHDVCAALVTIALIGIPGAVSAARRAGIE